MSRRRQIYEGKAKVLFEGPEPGTLVQYFKDDAHDGDRKIVLDGKGVLTNRISEYIMSRLNEMAIPTHFIRRLNMREQLIHGVEIVPLTIMVRNVAAGSLVRRFELEEGADLPRPMVEYYLKKAELGYPLVTEEHIAAFSLCGPHELEDMVGMALRVNDFLSGLFTGVGIRLVDIRMEFGRQFDGDLMRIILADEISPNNCRLWDRQTKEILDHDRLERDLGGVTQAYAEVARRLGIMQESISQSSGSGPKIVK